MSRKVVLTAARRRTYELDARTLNYYRRNPIIACEDLLGIYLSDIQAYMLACSWNAEKICWSCSRNFGKSFLIVVFAALKAILYEDQNIYIISSVGNQAKETFNKLEEIAKRTGRTAQSIPDLKDILGNETKTNDKNVDGFKHDPGGFSVEFMNGSKIVTLNSKPDSTRGRRASLVIYDEAAFIDEELIVATLPFITQSSEAVYGKDTADTKNTITRKPPLQALYASSQDTLDTTFYKRYKEYAKYMIAGDTRYFVVDCPCDLAMTMYHKGKEIPPLLSKSVVDAEMKSNPEKARREYYNVPDLTGGDNQIFKYATLRHNERQMLPTLDFTGNKIILAFDPARTGDNSILSAMEIVEDTELGICGNIMSCSNFIDTTSSQKFKLDSNRQLELIRNAIVRYNGDNPDYEFIDSLLIDAGAGGGGQSTYADQLLNDWVDYKGKSHHGFIDTDSDLYKNYRSRYPKAVDKVRLINPRKYRTQMIEEAIELMELGVIRFPYQYNGQEFITVIKDIDENGEEIMDAYQLSPEEMVNLKQIDLMKTELLTFRKTSNGEGMNVNYQLAVEKRNTMHDDRASSVGARAA